MSWKKMEEAAESEKKRNGGGQTFGEQETYGQLGLTKTFKKVGIELLHKKPQYISYT